MKENKNKPDGSSFWFDAYNHGVMYDATGEYVSSYEDKAPRVKSHPGNGTSNEDDSTESKRKAPVH